MSIEEKINTIAGEMYGAASVVLSAKVKETIRAYTEKVRASVEEVSTRN